jgi:hypothetical protein
MEFRGKAKSPTEYSPQDLQPKTANDLTVKEITLPMRKQALDDLTKIKSKLREIETLLILEPKEENKKLDNAAKFQLISIRRMIDQHQIQSRCEICQKKTLIYDNYCSKAKRDGEKGIIEDLMLLRNISVRVDFLINQVSSSLSNQLNKEELTDAIHEVTLFNKIF